MSALSPCDKSSVSPSSGGRTSMTSGTQAPFSQSKRRICATSGPSICHGPVESKESDLPPWLPKLGMRSSLPLSGLFGLCYAVRFSPGGRRCCTRFFKCTERAAWHRDRAISGAPPRARPAERSCAAYTSAMRHERDGNIQRAPCAFGVSEGLAICCARRNRFACPGRPAWHPRSSRRLRDR